MGGLLLLCPPPPGHPSALEPLGEPRGTAREDTPGGPRWGLGRPTALHWLCEGPPHAPPPAHRGPGGVPVTSQGDRQSPGNIGARDNHPPSPLGSVVSSLMGRGGPGPGHPSSGPGARQLPQPSPQSFLSERVPHALPPHPQARTRTSVQACSQVCSSGETPPRVRAVIVCPRHGASPRGGGPRGIPGETHAAVLRAHHPCCPEGALCPETEALWPCRPLLAREQRPLRTPRHTRI